MPHLFANRTAARRRPAPVALGLSAVIWLIGAAQAEDHAAPARDAAAALAQPALVECALQTVAHQAPTQTMRPNVVMMGTSVSADPLDNYARSRDGEWQVPAVATSDDPWIRLLVLPPEKPLVVDLAVTIEGSSFRAVRASWEELLLSQAKGKYAPAEQPDLLKVDSTSKQAVEETSPVDAPSEQPVPAANAPAADSEPASDPTKVSVQRRETPTVIERLSNYVLAVDDQVDPEEVRWLLADWTGGPELLVLGPAASWQRLEVAPLWSWLDTDGNHSLSALEIAAAADRLHEADVDEDGIVEVAELLRNEQTGSPYDREFNHPLVVVIDDNTDWYALLDDLADVYGGQYAATSAAELEALKTQSPDLVCRAALDAKSGALAVLAVSPELGDASQALSAGDKVITAHVGSSYVELAAVNYSGGKGNDLPTPQVAIGAVVDGYPLWRLLDADNDLRLTAPEQRQLPDLLAGLDRDGDGQIDQREIPTAVRLAVTTGPHVHEALAERTPAAQLRTKERLPVPSWFTDMDRNRDGELSRREFLGTSTQFDELDRDGNDLIGDQEVQEPSPTGESP